MGESSKALKMCAAEKTKMLRCKERPVCEGACSAGHSFTGAFATESTSENRALHHAKWGTFLEKFLRHTFLRFN